MVKFRYFERIFKHLDLMDRMMDTVGVTDRLKSLPNAANVLRRASARCRTCTETGDCSAFLDSHDRAGAAPEYCRNHELFERLKREIETDQAAA